MIAKILTQILNHFKTSHEYETVAPEGPGRSLVDRILASRPTCPGVKLVLQSFFMEFINVVELINLSALLKA